MVGATTAEDVTTDKVLTVEGERDNVAETLASCLVEDSETKIKVLKGLELRTHVAWLGDATGGLELNWTGDALGGEEKDWLIEVLEKTKVDLIDEVTNNTKVDCFSDVIENPEVDRIGDTPDWIVVD